MLTNYYNRIFDIVGYTKIYILIFNAKNIWYDLQLFRPN